MKKEEEEEKKKDSIEWNRKRIKKNEEEVEGFVETKTSMKDEGMETNLNREDTTCIDSKLRIALATRMLHKRM